MSLFGNEHFSLHLYWIIWVLRNNGYDIKIVDAINYLKKCVEVYQKYSENKEFSEEYERVVSLINSKE